MKWILIIVGAIVAIVVTVIVIGYLLPEKHTASRAARYSASPEQVWAAITDVGAFPAWRPDVTSVEQLPAIEGRPSWKEIGSDGTITYRVVTAVPPSAQGSGKLITQIADKDLPFGGEWEYEITRDGTGSRLMIVERGEVYNPVFRFMSRFVFGHSATMDRYLASLRSRVDTTEPAVGQRRDS